MMSNHCYKMNRMIRVHQIHNMMVKMMIYRSYYKYKQMIIKVKTIKKQMSILMTIHL
jgi:ACT domain-containing protein